MRIRKKLFAVATVLSSIIAIPVLFAADTAPTKVDGQQLQQAVDRGISFLLTKGQAADGSYSAAASPAITSLCTAAIMRNGRSPDDPAVAKSLKYIEQLVKPDGGIYGEKTSNKNYETAIGLMCLVEANKDRRYDKQIAAAEKFLKGLQWGSKEGMNADPSNVNYGGAGYGRKNRPDLSNSSFLLDALQAAGNGPDDEAVQRALVFVSRCQNLESQYNTTPFAAKNPDGGFYYTPAAGGESQAGIDPASGGLRSYASMTYAGLKSMIYAGVGPDDPRVKAAVAWLQKHYDLTSNPGMQQQGLYYYYQTFAKALAAMGHDIFTDEMGVQHNWRAELIAQLAKQQRDDGSWINEVSRWMEGDANLVTGYALLALSYCKPSPTK
ncbi:MAG: terpene cyclase/mutase family protein [Pirellulales bacterium]|nr:terpene cyclase/mutase family protein [Pirellulales bacterium]